MSDHAMTPQERARLLIGNAPSIEFAPRSSLWVGLGPRDGWFELSCYTEIAQEYDWLGLYAPAATNVYDYVTWQSVSTGKTELVSGGTRLVWTSAQHVNSQGFYACYVAWDYGNARYREVARTPPYLGKATL